MRRLLLGAGVLVLIVAGFTVAARPKILQPSAAPTSPPSPTSPPTSAPVPVRSQSPTAHPAPRTQLGIDIDLYTYPGQDSAAAAATDVAYIVNLHANAVSISFPFFMAGPSAAGVHASSATPTPGRLATLVRAAKRAGLYVSLRPLLDETNLRESRVVWVPAHPAAWFASYRRFLLPYAAMAQREHANEFIVGAEFSRFSLLPQWNGLDKTLRATFHGTLGCADNWSEVPSGVSLSGRCGLGVSQSVDAYHPVQGNLLRGWEAFDRTLPAGTVETEIGIDAVKGAYQAPARHHWDTRLLDQSVQARWFTAACQAAAVTHLGGIYFWSLGFSQTIGNGPTPKYQGVWAGGRGARAIAACFAELGRVSH